MPRLSFIDYSSLLDCKNLRAGFTLKSGALNPENDRQALAKFLGLNPGNLVQPGQKHTAVVQRVTKAGIVPETDGIVTTELNLVLSIQVADCVPLFLCDPEKEVIGLIHAGWRGAAAQIGKKALAVFNRAGSQMNTLRALIGPCIHSCCFQVGVEVAGKFPSEFSKPVGDKFFLDLPAAVKGQLLEAGMEEHHIRIVPDCTCCQPETFFSYRREGKKAGRMVAVIGWKKLSI